MDTAFQSDAFQNDAFQIEAATAARQARRSGSRGPLLVPPRSITGGVVLPAVHITGSVSVVEDESWLFGLTPFVI